MKKKYPVKPEKCMSTHGASGYTQGSYEENGVVICGVCGTKITNPNKTNYHREMKLQIKPTI